MAVARITAQVREDSKLEPAAFTGETGDAVGWVEVGGYELALWGSAGELRGLADAALAAAEDAERLTRRHESARRAA